MKTIKELLQLDSGHVIDWLIEHQHLYEIVPIEHINKAKPTLQTGEISTIVMHREGNCEGCEWHPDVCGVCEINNKE